MNIVTAVSRRLREDPKLVGLARIDKYTLAEEVASAGDAAVVVTLQGSWNNSFQTARFPRIGIYAHADHSRLPDGTPVAYDNHDRALEIATLVDEILHRPTMEDVVWGGPTGVRVLMSVRETEPSPIDRTGSDVALLRSTYDLKVG